MKVRNLMAKGIVLGAAVATLTGLVASRAWADDAKGLYDDKCAGCHGSSGKGDGPAGAALTPTPPNFSTSLKGKDDAYLAKIIKDGGEAVKKSASMPANSDLTDAQIKALVQYIKGL
ncbi:MAG: cytochrome c [Candidatus Binataceae bacterium]|jgi:high-affinity iron transporter